MCWIKPRSNVKRWQTRSSASTAPAKSRTTSCDARPAANRAGSRDLGACRTRAEINESIEGIVSNKLSDVSGTLRLSAPPSISDTLLAPLVCAFQASYPGVRVQILVTNRFVDHIAEGVDLVFRLGVLKDSSLVAKRLLTYRHQLLASPGYLGSSEPAKNPNEGAVAAN